MFPRVLFPRSQLCKILFSFFDLVIINQAYCMWFKDTCFISQKHQQSPRCFPATDKMFQLLSLKYCRGRQLRLNSNNFWNHLLLLQPSCFLYCRFLFCKPPVRACQGSLSSCSPLIVCIVHLQRLLPTSARASTAARSGSVLRVSFPPPFALPDLMQNLSQAYAQLRLCSLFCLLIASRLAILRGKGPVITLLESWFLNHRPFLVKCIGLCKRRNCSEVPLAGTRGGLDQNLIRNDK